MDDEWVVAVNMVNIATVVIHELVTDDDETEVNVLEKNENFAEYTVPNFNDLQFKEHFRMLRTTMEILLKYIHDSTDVRHEVHRGQPEIPIEKQALITLWCLSNVESFRYV